MTITKETIAEVVNEMKITGTSLEEIEDNFKVALKTKMIDIDTYCAAMEEIYK